MDAVFSFSGFLCLQSWHAQKKKKSLSFIRQHRYKRWTIPKRIHNFRRKKHRQGICLNPVYMKQHKQQSRRLLFICAGEVCNPGVYVLQAGSRLYQAVEEAGGLTANARAEAVNLARILVDSEQIYIPNISESIDQIENETQNVISSAAVSSALSDGLLNINQASESDLMQLPGIGQVKAAAIVTYRNSNGPFSSIEEIKNVPG